ncbi:hypothetical protein DLM_3944 [Aquitalea magnusonii]|jgi:hypothetical protein|uniref:Uncharacterized protein n=1 Tax=Aquitalea magnusonii TaxID=332411 RepID=A0A3G9GL71_9NEIS|nr:hypothetical protein DLM_3944 [Aquitalea magnusonii]
MAQRVYRPQRPALKQCSHSPEPGFSDQKKGADDVIRA